MNTNKNRITNEEEYEKAIETIETLWDSKEGTPEYQAKVALLGMVHDYENSGADELFN